MPKLPGRVSRLCILVVCLFVAASCSSWRQPEVRLDTGQEGAPGVDPRLPFGNPSNAAADPANRDNILLVKLSYVVSYNNSRGAPNWAAWRVSAADLGEGSERPDFEPDPTLPPGFVRVTPSDYTGSGYDRGHLVPNADRYGSPQANAETFVMTNIVPQKGDLNRFPWERLERYSRSIVRRGNDVYIIAGVYGEKGRLRGKVTVPTNCWKIVIVLPLGGQLVINPDTRVIAVDMPNREGIKEDNWRKYLTTVRDIEQKTGFDFFTTLPRELQDVLETRVDAISQMNREE